MDALPKTNLFRFVDRAVMVPLRTIARYSSKDSKTRSTIRQHVILLCLRVKKTTHHILADELIKIPRIREALDLDSCSPTLYKAFDGLEWLSGVTS